jgi:putative aldouronate transport system permease protein
MDNTFNTKSRGPRSSGVKNPLFRFIKEIIDRRTFYLMALPGLLFIFIFSYIPMYGSLIAFKEYNPVKGILRSKWIGLKNFEFFFKSDSAITVTFNTVFYSLIIMVSVTVLSLLFAVLLNEVGNKYLTSTYKTLMLLPFFLSWVVGEVILYSLLSIDKGMINNIRASLGMEAIQWYSEPSYWRFIMPLAYIWKNVGYYSVLYVAAIAGISPDYYEAAEIDGASKFKQFTNITVPLLTPVIFTLLLLWCGKIFNGGLGDWNAFYTLPADSGILYPTTNVIDTHVFRALKAVNDVGMASAVGLYQSVVGFVLVMLSNYAIKKYDAESSLF